MKLLIEVNLDSDAFAYEGAQQDILLAMTRAPSHLQVTLSHDAVDGRIQDINGNTVGWWEVKKG